MNVHLNNIDFQMYIIWFFDIFEILVCMWLIKRDYLKSKTIYQFISIPNQKALKSIYIIECEEIN